MSAQPRSILFNPGGPGGSGSGVIVGLGETISTMVDGRYDTIGFDPRAVNLTGPSTACHDVELKFAERAYQLHTQGVPFPYVGGSGEIAHVAKLSAIQSSHHAVCVQNGNHEMLRNSGTVAVAKDMERIVEALGEDGLNFIGYSYGTILGATFAAMRPNLIKRMVLDGISDAEAYFNDALEWGRSGIQDSHKTFAGFISTCIDAGPVRCVLASTRDNKTETVDGLTKRLNALHTKLGKEPLVTGDSLTGPGIIQAHNVQLIVFTLIYNPRDWLALAQMEGYTDYFREMGKISPVGEQLALIIGGCRGWSFRASERYTGPWTTEKGLNKTKFGHPSFSHPSLCTAKNIRDYFVDGKVPKNGTYCTPEPGWIYPASNATSKRPMLNKRDKDLLEAVKKIGRMIFRMPVGF
ncbi:unnamed protein product [Rhizoctonia solani]|uniref:AB hydrolase-1 domain-containing protein n=1 Tax=Rhizoctonia solani TaxID=456999 RepID=A0A8H3B6V4_9AGAM|nr:unnamed protein product [Rhizoctonia solani]